MAKLIDIQRFERLGNYRPAYDPTIVVKDDLVKRNASGDRNVSLSRRRPAEVAKVADAV